MELRQLGGPADPGFRLDLDGTARFVHQGFTVTVQARRATPEDHLYYYRPAEHDPHDVVVSGIVTLENTDVGTASAVANERDGHNMREALEDVLRASVDDARRTVARLSVSVERIDREHRTEQP
ncbi:hypothetical protein [Streptomyces anulatus]|uniref:hypothetical protein n=1 Tax=Streptomyces anulatus TaxID=1892 RepID=UPI001C2793AA|nr:hypothetical protein [Streptomyces anulatus]